MKNEPMTIVSRHAGTISLEAERPEDEAFLLEVYGSTRQDDLNLTGWDSTTRAAFVKMQFDIRRRGYATLFPNGQFSIVLLNQFAVGRIVVNRVDREIRVVDLALLPAYRGQGIGTYLLQQLFSEAAQAGKPVRLQVLKTSRALRRYQWLGFRTVGEDGVYCEMEWRSTV